MPPRNAVETTRIMLTLTNTITADLDKFVEEKRFKNRQAAIVHIIREGLEKQKTRLLRHISSY